MVNDVSGLRDAAMRAVVLERGCAGCIMHMLGSSAGAWFAGTAILGTLLA